MRIKLKLGKYEFDKPLILAPMAGYTDIAFREIAYSLGASFAVTEIIMANSLIYNNQKGFELMDRGELDNPFIVQIAGPDENILLEGAKIVLKKQNPDVIDINMGCPMPKIVKPGSGSALLKNPRKIYDIVKMLKDNIDLPITVKIRLGWDNNSLNYIEITKLIEKAGADMITIHRRTRSQMYGDIYPTSVFKEIRENVSLPLIYNGNILTTDDIDEMFELGADGVMIGRGALKNPWIFSHKNDASSIKEKYELLKKHLDLLLKYHNEKKAVSLMKVHYGNYVRDFENAKAIKNELVQINNANQVKDKIEEIFKELI